MRNAGAIAVLTVGLAGVAVADPVWRPVGPVATPAPAVDRPAAPSPTPSPGGLVWQPAKPADPAPLPPTVTPRPTFGPVRLASETQPPTATPPLALPQPRPVAPAPRPVPTPTDGPAPMPMPAGPSPESVWGVGPEVQATPPDWPTVGGSPNLTLTRDRHLLDLVGVPLSGEDGNTVVLGEGPARDRGFVSAEYLLWWVRSANVPLLATTAAAGGDGFVGRPDTVPLLGPGAFGPTLHDGFRVRAGNWFGDADQLGWDASFLTLGRRSDGFRVDSPNPATITRPLFVPNLRSEFGEQVAFPGLATGSFAASFGRSLWGADVNLRGAVCRTGEGESAWFAGYRHLNLDESLTLSEFTSATAAVPGGPRAAFIRDSFVTRNRFHGGQLGWAVGRRNGRLDLDARLSVALGVTDQELSVSGYQLAGPLGAAPMAATGGLLAVGPALGKFERSRFGVVPEATVNLGYQLTPGFRTFIGYNFLYWSDVLRPGDQIDRTVDLAYVPHNPGLPFSGQARPRPPMHPTDLGVQGMQFGLELRW